SPLLLAIHHDMPNGILKSIPYFTSENQVTPQEHIQDVANVCSLYLITHNDVVVRLLVASFKGKAIQWYKGLRLGSINTGDDMGTTLYNYFEDNPDHLSLVEQLTTIRRAPNEQMSDFNIIFQKTWDRIPLV
ncbi:hypothetical protein KI387_031595, partial [Taxus chinensis]